MTPNASDRLQSGLKHIQQLPGVSAEAKLLAVREAIRSMLPVESYIVKAAAEQQQPIFAAATPAAAPNESTASNQRVRDLIDATLAFLPVATDTELATATPASRLGAEDPALAKIIETEVRLALNERFMASWIFKGVIVALGLALTVFSFGLFQMNSQVRRADQVVQEFNKQLSDSATLIATKDAELKQRLSAAQTQLLAEVERARDAAQLAQRDSIGALNQELSKRVKDVDDSRDKATAQIDARANEVNASRQDAIARIEKVTTQMVDTDVKQAATMAVRNLESERDSQLELFRTKAARIAEEIKQPTIHAVLGRVFWIVIGVVGLSVVTLAIALLALFRRR